LGICDLLCSRLSAPTGAEPALRIPLRRLLPFLDAHPIFIATTKNIRYPSKSFLQEKSLPAELTDGSTVRQIVDLDERRVHNT
jgi:hypothetical protein